VTPISLPHTHSLRRSFAALGLALVTAIVGTLVSPLTVSPVLAQQLKPNEYQIKALYLFNFGKFVKWPAETSTDKTASFTLCVLGQDPFGSILDSTLSKETLDGKPVVLKRIQRGQDASECRIVFVSSAEEKHLKEILSALDKNGALTVSDMPDFTQRGGMIQFTLEDGKIRFEINLASTENARLVLSSELLKVAASIRKSAPAGV
jgi:YfiR/HmsC-like